MKNLKTRLIIYYIVSIFISITGLIFTSSHVHKFVINGSNVILERYAILITLIGIPLALKLFHSQVKKLSKANYLLYLKKYHIQYIIRLLILLSICFFNIICLYITGAKNFYFLIIITIFVFFLCAPQKAHLVLPEKEENIEIE